MKVERRQRWREGSSSHDGAGRWLGSGSAWYPGGWGRAGPGRGSASVAVSLARALALASWPASPPPPRQAQGVMGRDRSPMAGLRAGNASVPGGAAVWDSAHGGTKRVWRRGDSDQ